MKIWGQISLLFFLWLGHTTLFAQSDQTLLINELDRIAADDQRFRGKVIEDEAKKFGWNSQQVSAIWKKQEQLDVANLQKIAQIISQFGYPGKSLVGEKRKSIIFVVVQHADLETREKYFPLLKQAAANGEFAESSLALMIDRNLTDRGKSQIYGSQMRETEKYVKLYPIVDEHEVDQRRAAVGLGPLAIYLKEFGISYQLPTKTQNPNPKTLYFSFQEKEKPTVELIGGESELYAQIIYPAAAKLNGIKGKVTLQLTVDKNGDPKDIEVVRGLGNGCDEEALRVMKIAKFKNYTHADHEIRMNLPFPYQQ